MPFAMHDFFFHVFIRKGPSVASMWWHLRQTSFFLRDSMQWVPTLMFRSVISTVKKDPTISTLWRTAEILVANATCDCTQYGPVSFQFNIQSDYQYRFGITSGFLHQTIPKHPKTNVSRRTFLNILIPVRDHPGCAWQARTGRKCRTGENYYKMTGTKTTRNHQSSVSTVLCWMPGCASHLFVDTWCTFEILMLNHVGRVLQHVHLRVSIAKLFGSTVWRQINGVESKCPLWF